MALSRRNKATLLGVLAFGAVLASYLLLRAPDREPAGAARPAADNAAVDQGRSLGRTLSSLLRSPEPKKGAPEVTPPTHSAGPSCEKCTNENCAPGTDDGCDAITDANDRKACEELYGCFAANNCVVQGDPIPCWCGTHMTTCVTESSGPKQANGPCAKQMLAAAKTSDADTIFHQLLNIDLPLGRAVRLTTCRGSFCSSDCKIP